MVHDGTKLEVYGTVYLQWRVRGRSDLVLLFCSDFALREPYLPLSLRRELCCLLHAVRVT